VQISGFLFYKKNHGYKSAKYAFTMLELVFVIVVVGILAATMAPRFSRDSLQEASDKLISQLRYTKHLAMVDDKFDNNNALWYKERWQLLFANTVDGVSGIWSYTIFADTLNHDGSPNIADDIAINPTNPNMYLSGGFGSILHLNDARRDKTMALGETYGIEDIQFLGGCSTAKRISFDYLGRPISGDLSTSSKPYQSDRLLKTQCRIALCKNNPCDDNNITIAIEPQTGYIHIL
jgi:prepilin-type N-terminal cleavage/methylation domain-containing protein